MKKIAIIDYGLGNLRSVIRGLEKAGANAVITCDAGEIASADGLVLPGVGAFHEGMEQLGPLQETVVAAARRGTAPRDLSWHADAHGDERGARDPPGTRAHPRHA